jgi:hypothetical protein
MADNNEILDDTLESVVDLSPQVSARDKNESPQYALLLAGVESPHTELTRGESDHISLLLQLILGDDVAVA